MTTEGLTPFLPYAYDQNDRLLSETKDSADDSKDTTTTYAFSSTVQVGKTVHAGLTEQGAVIERTTYGWNESGRMISQTVEKGGQTIVSEYGYDDRGLKISAKEGGHTTTYLFDTQNMTGYSQAIEERTDGTLSKTYTLGLERLAQVLANGVMQNFLTDGQGSTRQITDANGQVIDIAQNDAGQGVKFTVFEAYGQAMNFAVASAVTSYLYQGMWTNPQGLQNPEQRWMMAGSGRFLSTDPYRGGSDPASLHRYNFTPSNPTNFRDPNGMWSLTEMGTVGEIIASLRLNSALALQAIRLVLGRSLPGFAKFIISGLLPTGSGYLLNLGAAYIMRTMALRIGIGLAEKAIAYYMVYRHTRATENELRLLATSIGGDHPTISCAINQAADKFSNINSNEFHASDLIMSQLGFGFAIASGAVDVKAHYDQYTEFNNALDAINELSAIIGFKKKLVIDEGSIFMGLIYNDIDPSSIVRNIRLAYEAKKQGDAGAVINSFLEIEREVSKYGHLEDR